MSSLLEILLSLPRYQLVKAHEKDSKSDTVEVHMNTLPGRSFPDQKYVVNLQDLSDWGNLQDSVQTSNQLNIYIGAGKN